MLRYRGLSPDDYAVFDDQAQPLAAWTESTVAIRQTAMRSESEGHLFPTDFPGFALIDAIRNASVAPLVLSAVNRYHPDLRDILAHGLGLAAAGGMPERTVRVRVARIRREIDPEPHFALFDHAGSELERARHVFLSLGHGPLRWPEACAEPEQRAGLTGVLFHAYEPKPDFDCSVMVIGSGMAAMTEWLNVLEAGGTVIAVRRGREIVEQPLSAPRHIFGGPWLDRYHALSAEDRMDVLRQNARGSFPGRHWLGPLPAAERDGRLRKIVGTVVDVERHGDGVKVTLVGSDGSREKLQVGAVIAATGFRPGWQEQEVLVNLVRDYSLETRGPYLALEDDCTIPGLSQPGSILSVAGVSAAWAYPGADSFSGLKYAARRFSAQAVPGVAPPRQIVNWWRALRAGWPPRPVRERVQPGRQTCSTP